MSDIDFITSDKLKTLIDINVRINSSYSDVDALMVYILESAMQLVECESSSLLLVNDDDGSLSFAVALGPKGADAKNIPVDKRSIAGWVVQNNKPLVINNVAEDPRFFTDVQIKTGYVSHTMIAIPMCVDNKCIGVIELINKSENRYFDDNDLKLLQLLCMHAGIAYQNAARFKNVNDQIKSLQYTISESETYHSFVAKSSVIMDLLHIVEEAAKTTSSVLITGESGVGKELFAEQLHIKSPRRDKPFVRVNCAALAPSLLESELFGHVKGAFTDASANRKGRFEMADGGTLFLDEIGELPIELQAKLLRVIQEKSFERVGSSETINVDVRIVAATNKDLEQNVKEGKFRNDLYYRLNVVPLRIPPLRSRKEDIEPLAVFFLNRFSSETKKKFDSFEKEAMEVLYNYSWPGNIRELENTIERACVLGTPPLIKKADLRLNSAENDKENVKNDRFSGTVSDIMNGNDLSLKTALNAFKKEYVKKILEMTDYHQTKAAGLLGIQRTYLARLLNELGIREK
ncbi:MAG: sigma 54-interacting transcriptional regulator [Treponema sp.]|uniref:sigma-54-dependent Fis family transcriptional regulator n=1 Tax=Treponema sp. TaxID=166 RepID=UPI001B4A3764|nr:sigma 54-interacting transcriptional regulator [Treponema sp.]MBP5402316.1 sigma 54-interacting transcriptional regulator [Treponema sp.]MBR5933185.1 sigma 54-interacting transcriptional regulator [Treponema sp.]